jgi:ParB-like chromosome segregation protein Spo0J
MASKKKAEKRPVAKFTEAPEVENRVPATLKATEGKIADQSYRLAKVSDLKLHPKNPKKGNVDAIGESIDHNRFYGAIYVQKSTGFMLAGNHRWQAAVAKGLELVPIIEIDCDDATAERILLGDNKIAELGSYDDRAVLALLEAQKQRSGSLAGTGYKDEDLVRLATKYAPPQKFQEYTEAVKVHYQCPSCGFKW